MRDKDLRRCAAAVYRNRVAPQRQPFRSRKEEWSAMRFMDWALPLLIESGAIGAEAADDGEG